MLVFLCPTGGKFYRFKNIFLAAARRRLFKTIVSWYNILMVKFLRLIKKESGFTIFELLVVMFILTLLSSVVLAGYHSGQKRYSLYQAAQKLASDVRRAQNMAISGVDIAGNYYGYGVYAVADGSSYLIYGDTDNTSDYQPTDTTVETIYLPNNVKIKETVPDAGKADVFFRPPDPDTYLNGVSGSYSEPIIITLELIGTSLTKIITVAATGLVEVSAAP